jgi:hypothetical protein
MNTVWWYGRMIWGGFFVWFKLAFLGSNLRSVYIGRDTEMVFCFLLLPTRYAYCPYHTCASSAMVPFEAILRQFIQIKLRSPS